ncbi:hypothetical protein ABW19_dt0208714 [Dactylella cylindrospora]|nr:hypothetical protein ABW19_dt0208714 [Dactylella cylindrospora]
MAHSESNLQRSNKREKKSLADPQFPEAPDTSHTISKREENCQEGCQLYYWFPNYLINQTDIDALNATVTEASARYNATEFCTTPYTALYDDLYDQRERLLLIKAHRNSYLASTMLGCKDGYSIRLFNFRLPWFDQGKSDVRIFCQDALNITRNLFGILRAEWEETKDSLPTKADAPHASPDLPRHDGKKDLYVFGESFWNQDWAWGLVLAREINGTCGDPNEIWTSLKR